jgi:hypothetical protein
MKNKGYSPYATNKGGKIEAPRKCGKDEPRAKRTEGSDLRIKKG